MRSSPAAGSAVTLSPAAATGGGSPDSVVKTASFGSSVAGGPGALSPGGRIAPPVPLQDHNPAACCPHNLRRGEASTRWEGDRVEGAALTWGR